VGRFTAGTGTATLTFDAEQLGHPVIITITGVNDDVRENRQYRTITHTVSLRRCHLHRRRRRVGSSTSRSATTTPPRS
jgi:hypothetical protein